MFDENKLIYIAIYNDRFKIAKYLIEMGAEVCNLYIDHMIIKFYPNKLDSLKFLVEHNMFDVHRFLFYGTIMHQAVCSNSDKVLVIRIKQIIELGFDITRNIIDNCKKCDLLTVLKNEFPEKIESIKYVEEALQK